MMIPEEDQLVAALAASCPRPNANVAVGIGDDCAVIEGNTGHHFLFKTDCVVEGIHFESNCAPELVGRKALCRVLSDIAAMAGEPGPFLVTAGLGGAIDASWLKAAYVGIGDVVREFGGSLAGGETSRSPGAGFLSIAMLGHIPTGRSPILRSGGCVGDAIFVTGELGNSISGWHLRFRPRIEESLWLADHFQPSAMLDLSDGLATDLPRMAAASGTGYQIERNALPLREGATPQSAISDGEDYELLFSVPVKRADGLEDAWASRFPKLQLTRIGCLTEPGHCDDLGRGFDHLASNRKREDQA